MKRIKPWQSNSILIFFLTLLTVCLFIFFNRIKSFEEIEYSYATKNDGIYRFSILQDNIQEDFEVEDAIGFLWHLYYVGPNGDFTEDQFEQLTGNWGGSIFLFNCKINRRININVSGSPGYPVVIDGSCSNFIYPNRIK